MKRVKSENGIVHFVGAHNKTLCGSVMSCNDLLGKPLFSMAATQKPVTCPNCAELYCRIKNAPWNEVEDDTLDKAIYDAVENKEN